MNIEPIKLLSGDHSDTGTTGQGCFMNVISYLNGDLQITDDSPCVCVTIRPIAIYLNDLVNDEQRQRLLPFVLRAMGSSTDDIEEIKRRLVEVVKYAEKNAEITDTKNAKYVAKLVAKRAELFNQYGCKKDAAIAAGHFVRVIPPLKVKEAVFQAGLDFLDAVCPPLKEHDSVILDRFEKLVELAGEELANTSSGSSRIACVYVEWEE